MLGGSFVPITCIKFMPCIFSRNGKSFSIFAVGDAYGNISIWEIGDGSEMDAPLCLIKADDYNMTIENIEFEPSGEFLVASTDRKFFIVITFGDHSELCSEKIPKDLYIEKVYGRKNFGNEESFKTYKDIVSGANANMLAESLAKDKEVVLTSGEKKGFGAQEIVAEPQAEEIPVAKKPNKIVYRKGKKVEQVKVEPVPSTSTNNNNSKKAVNGNAGGDASGDKILNELDAAPKEEPEKKLGHFERLNNSIEEIMPCNLASSSGNKINPIKSQFDAMGKASALGIDATKPVQAAPNFPPVLPGALQNLAAPTAVPTNPIAANPNFKRIKPNPFTPQTNVTQNSISTDQNASTIVEVPQEKKVIVKSDLEYLSRIGKLGLEGVFHIAVKNSIPNTEGMSPIDSPPQNCPLFCLKYKKKLDDRVSTKKFIAEANIDKPTGALPSSEQNYTTEDFYMTTLEMTQYKNSATTDLVSTNLNSAFMWSTSLEGALLACEWNQNMIVLYTDKLYLYLISLSSGRRLELPLNLGHLHMLKMAINDSLMVLKTNGDLIIFDFEKNCQRLRCNIIPLLRDHYKLSGLRMEEPQALKGYEGQFSLFLTHLGEPVIQLDLLTYMTYNNLLGVWTKVDPEFIFANITSDQCSKPW